jgi:sRNA-binding regulator protein Hfq
LKRDAFNRKLNKSFGFLSLFFMNGIQSRLFTSSFDSSYLVDPASSHMLVSKIKPCMSKYKHLYTVKLRTAHYISYYLFDGTLLHGYP